MKTAPVGGQTVKTVVEVGFKSDIEHGQATTPYARCGWCDIETGILKIDVNTCGVTCSKNCEHELREHYK